VVSAESDASSTRSWRPDCPALTASSRPRPNRAAKLTGGSRTA